MQGHRINLLRLETPEKMLFALLRSSLHQQAVEQEYFGTVTDRDWKDCYRIAARQGVMALAWDGVLRLPAALQPPLALKITWGLAVEEYEKKYARYCRTIQELSDYYASQGIVTVQMKGVGFSSYYPVPAHREGGDLDIYTFSADTSVRSHQEANTLADKLMQEQGIEVENHSVKHSNFFYKGVPVENHKNFLNVERYDSASAMNDLLHRVLDPQETELLGGECRILTPSLAFNTVFIAYHAAQHYGSGLALHHLCDWAAILIRYGLQLPEEVKDKGFLRMIASLNELCNACLGTKVDFADSEGEAAVMLEEILHPKYRREVPYTGKVQIFRYKMRRILHAHRLQRRVLQTSLAECLWSSIMIHWRSPKLIFSRGEK